MATPSQHALSRREARVCPYLLALKFVWLHTVQFASEDFALMVCKCHSDIEFVLLHLGQVVSADFAPIGWHLASWVRRFLLHIIQELSVGARRRLQLQSLYARGQTWDEKSFFHDFGNCLIISIQLRGKSRFCRQKIWFCSVADPYKNIIK